MNRTLMLALTLLAAVGLALPTAQSAIARQYDDSEKQRAYDRHKDQHTLIPLSRAQGDDPNGCISVVVEAKNYPGNRCPQGQHRWGVSFLNFCAQPVQHRFAVLPALPSMDGDALGSGWYTLQSVNDPVITRFRDNHELAVIFGGNFYSACVARDFVDTIRIRWCANWTHSRDAQGETADGVAYCEFRNGHPRIIVTERPG